MLFCCCFLSPFSRDSFRIPIAPDNSPPHMNVKLTTNQTQFTRLRAAYPHPSMLIVSNTAGTPSMDPDLTSSALLGAATSVPVLAHRTKKPGCSAEIMAHFHSHAELRDLKPEEVAIVGDRLATDVVLANRMGAYAVWVREGVVAKEEKSLFARWEYGIYDWLKKRGVQSPVPGSPFE